MSNSNIIDFLRKRGFILHDDTENRYRIDIGHRSIGGGLNEIFVETDELDAIERLGRIIKIVYGDDTIKLSVKEKLQTLYEENQAKNTSRELKERLEQRKDEKGGK
jgi:hypothetical protein